MTTEIILSRAPGVSARLAFHPDAQAARRVLEFFTAQINNDNTRKAHLNATRRSAEWCDARGIGQLSDVQAFHVAAFVKHLQGKVTQTSSSSIPAAVDRHAALMKAQR
jgi:site-specific recombinase XerD